MIYLLNREASTHFSENPVLFYTSYNLRQKRCQLCFHWLKLYIRSLPFWKIIFEIELKTLKEFWLLAFVCSDQKFNRSYKQFVYLFCSKTKIWRYIPLSKIRGKFKNKARRKISNIKVFQKCIVSVNHVFFTSIN